VCGPLRPLRQSAIKSIAGGFEVQLNAKSRKYNKDYEHKYDRYCVKYALRFSQWPCKGVWQRIVFAMACETEVDQILIESTIVRANQHSANA
jgi:hypothetical protein